MMTLSLSTVEKHFQMSESWTKCCVCVEWEQGSCAGIGIHQHFRGDALSGSIDFPYYILYTLYGNI